MTEREMLEAAARAIGLKINEKAQAEYDSLDPATASLWIWIRNGSMAWNPRNNSAESFALAAALRISVEHNHPADHEPWVSASVERIDMCMGVQCFMEDVPDESQRADRMRLAILRCAAAHASGEVV